jgi:hypothetical protein
MRSDGKLSSDRRLLPALVHNAKTYSKGFASLHRTLKLSPAEACNGVTCYPILIS